MNKLNILIAVIGLTLAGCTGFRPFNDEEAIKMIIDRNDQVMMGDSLWDGPTDCSARAYLNRTNSTLLFTIEVYDDSLKTGAPESYMNDGVEVYFDLRPLRLRENNFYQEGVFQAIILPEPGKKQLAPIEWFPKTYDADIPGTRAYTELRDSGYVVQLSIPYSSLEKNHYWPRSSFYMDVAINDADTGRRESQLMWAGGRDNWNNPHNFKKVSFKEKGEDTDERPNIMLVFTDQQTISAMSAYGNQYLHTPNMDALARFGVRFTKSYCTAPVCSPSRSSMISGLMPHQTGVNFNEQSLDSSVMNLGEILQKEGYETVWGGKWHLPESYPHTSKESVRGFRLLNFLDEEKTSGRGSDTDEPLANEVVKYLRKRKNQPFFLAVSFHNPHDICYVPQNPDAFPFPTNIESAPPLPDNFRINPLEPEFLQDARTRSSYGNEIALTGDFSRDDWRNYLYHYYRMTENVDREIGQIIRTLENEGLDQNTVIIFTSDHGDGAASHHWAAKLSLYEESVNVPMIITWFGETPENIVDSKHLVSGLDIAPTILDYAGVKIPERMEGYSMKKVIENPDTTWREFLVTELAIDPSDSTKTARMITNGRYKYNLYSYGARNEQLFDLKNDPDEEVNLAYSPAYASAKRELRTKLMEWIEKTGDYFKVEK